VVKVFKHNDAADLERVLRNAIIEGQPLTRRPWKKIVIIVEGTYSMEGEYPPLPEIVALKKKYKCYLYVDEAHSIGAVGESGRGITEYYGIPPEDIDILMGTFTKSFGAAGGYMASSKRVVDYVRATTFAMYYDNGMPPPVAQQTLSALRQIAGEDGTQVGLKRIHQLRENSEYFRRKLKELKFKIVGHDSCPIVPLMIFHPVKLFHFSQMCLDRGLAVAVVSFPATPLLLGRARFCLSSAHSREDIDKVLQVLDEVGERLFLKYNRTGWDTLRAWFWD
jgi:serine palmitoyltransferase